MSNIDKRDEQKAIELLKNDPCISLNEVSRQTGVPAKKISEIVKEENIVRMTRKQYVENYLKEHPYYTYAIIEEIVKYGQGNIARLAKKCGLSRDPHEMTQMMKEEINSAYELNENFERAPIVEKYGVTLEEVEEIVNACKERIEKENRVSHKDRVIELLETTNLDYTNIANIVGCDLGYVSRLAKINKLQRTCSFAEALENNINYYLDNNPELSYEEIRVRLNRCPIDKVIKIAESKGISRNIVSEEKEIVEELKNNSTYTEISEKYDYGVSTIEKIAIKNGYLKRDAEKDKKVLEILKEKNTCTYVEISNILDYNYSLVKEVAEENGYLRTTIDYGGKNKKEIIELLEKNPKMTYKEIGKKVNRSQHTVWRIAKENNLGHNKKSKNK
jgi:DNA-binding Lrp family transcriptional regulator